MKGICYVAATLLALAAISYTPARSANGSPGQAVGQAPAEGHQARIELTAPETGRIGELIRFDLSESDVDSIKWLLVPGSADFETYNSGRNAVFSARVAGEYMFIIAAAKDGTVDVITHIITIKGPPERPATESLTQWIPYWLYPLNLPKDEASALAGSFESVSSRITELSTPEGIIEATAQGTREALGASLTSWKPLLGKIQVALAKRAHAGSLTSPQQHKETWSEIAKGLRSYAQ
jgi:hypothetical protein